MIQLIMGTVYTEIRPVPLRTAQMLEDRLRYLSADASPYNSNYTSGRWDGFVRLYDRTRGRFPTGLLTRVKRILDEQGIAYEIIRDRLPPMPATVERVFQSGVSLRDYQQEALAAALKWRRGIISIPTGGGKTEVAQAIINATGVARVVFLVPSRTLLHQTLRRMRRVFPDANVYQWGDGKRPPDDLPADYILVATVQSAFKVPHRMLTEAGAVFIDESHHQSAETFKSATNHCHKARIILGFSATVYRNDNADMELEAWIGPIIYKVDYEHLIKNGWLVPPEFHTVRTLADALNMTRGKKTLIFSEKLEDLKDAHHIFEEYNVTVLHGKSAGIQNWLRLFTLGDIDHIAATPLFDEGLDVPDIDAVVFYATCGARTRAMQRIGRAMRPSPGKKKCLVIDLLDDKYSDRMLAYLKEPAFAARLQ